MTTISWQAPTTFPNGDPITNEITGYKIYLNTGGEYSLYATTTNTSYSVENGTYAVAATFSGGQTILSDSITIPFWKNTIATPNDSNTVSSSDSRSAIQAKIDALTPGGVLYFRGGTYNHTLVGLTTGIFITVGVSGTSDNLITLMAYPGETPIIAGNGWSDDDVGPTPGTYQRGLILVTGNYIRLYGFEVKNSVSDGIRIRGSGGWLEELHVHDNWEAGIIVGIDSTAGVDVNNGTIIHCKIHHNRIYYGLFFGLDTNENYNADGWLIKHNLLYSNGFNSDGSINIVGGGGNSDGLAVSKSVHDAYLPGTGALDPDITGRANRMRDLLVYQNISWRNADDGFDVSSGEGTIFIGNISFHNGPSGTKGFKQFREHYETSSYIANIALSSTSSPFDNSILYFLCGSGASIVASDVITGATSGATATVSSVNLFEGASWANLEPGIFGLTGVSGVFQSGENLTVSSVVLAKVGATGQESGVDHRVNATEATRPYGRNNEIGWTSLNHNTPGDGSKRGISTNTEASRGGDFENNLSKYNQDSDTSLTNFTQVTNILNISGTTPGITNISYYNPSETLTGDTIQEQFFNLYRTILFQVMATDGGNLWGAGTLDLDYYHESSGDDPTNPSNPDGHTKMYWVKLDKGTDAPEIGAVQYEYMHPPIMLYDETISNIGFRPFYLKSVLLRR